jgi:hypothetical protein
MEEYQGIYKFADYVEMQKRFSKENTSIYHYTNLESLTKIIETKSLWATNCQYLNDIFETKHIESIFRDIAKEFQGVELSITNFLIELMNTKIHQEFIDKIYVISFTDENDSIAMWNNYGKNGVIIEFDSTAFYKNKIKRETNIIHKDIKSIGLAKFIMDVIYDNIKIKDYFIMLIKNIAKKINYNSENIENIIKKDLDDFTYLFLLCILFKDKSYSYEKEIRMAFCLLDDKDVGKVEIYRIKNNLIIPYLDISFEENSKLPIKRIGINPEQKDIMYIKGIERLLMSYGYDDVEIYNSKNKTREPVLKIV